MGILNTAIDGYVRASENLPIRLNLRCNFNRIIRNYERHVESFYKKHKENQELIGQHPECTSNLNILFRVHLSYIRVYTEWIQ